MATSNCNQNCGCNNSYTVTAPCPPACAEVFNAQCIVYTGTDIMCGDDTVISRYDYMDTVITKIINYFCGRFDSLVIPTTVVESDDPGIIVTSNVVGSVTTYILTLDPAELPSASQVTAGDNVVVTGDGTAGDPYVINADESIVAVEAGSPLTLVVDPATPGPYETLYTLGIDTDLLPDTFLQTSQGHISITEQEDVPTTGDTTYILDVDEVTVTAVDDRLTSTLTSPGGAPAFERTFDIAISDTEMANWIMDTVIFSSPSFPDGLIAGTGISLNWNPATFQLEIENTFDDPERWFELFDFAGNDVTPTSGSAILRILANPATVDLGGDGISAILSGTGTDANFQLLNTDPGSGQNIFGSVECNNGGPSTGTCTAGTNTDTLTIVGGAEIGVSVPVANTIVIDNLITSVYSNIAGDSGNVAAGTVTDSLEIIGTVGSGILTSITGAPGVATLEIDYEGTLTSLGGETLVVTGTSPDFEIRGLDAPVASGIGLASTGTTIEITNTSDIYSRIEGDGGATNVVSNGGLSDVLRFQGANGITVAAAAGSPDQVTITSPVNISEGSVTYTATNPAQTYIHGLGNQWVVARAFLGTADVTSTTVFTMTNATELTFSNGSSNIDRIVVIG